MSKALRTLIYGMIFAIIVGSQAFGSLATWMYLDSPEEDPFIVSSEMGFTVDWRFQRNLLAMRIYGPKSLYSSDYDPSAELLAWHCNIALAAPNGSLLKEGLYDATWWPNANQNAQMAIWENYLTPNDIVGEFQIFEMALGNDGNFAVDFEFCENGQKTKGAIRMNSSIPNTMISGATVPTPESAYLLFLGLALISGWWIKRGNPYRGSGN